MKSMIIDPNYHGCDVWLDGAFRSFKGNTERCIKQILPLIVHVDSNDKPFQEVIPYLNTIGIGCGYQYIFEELRIKYEKVKRLDYDAIANMEYIDYVWDNIVKR